MLLTTIAVKVLTWKVAVVCGESFLMESYYQPLITFFHDLLLPSLEEKKSEES